jgi:hypothetical protein
MGICAFFPYLERKLLVIFVGMVGTSFGAGKVVWPGIQTHDLHFNA